MSVNLLDLSSYYYSILSTINKSSQIIIFGKFRSFLPNLIEQNDILFVSSADIRSALKKLKQSGFLKSGSICFNHLSFDCPALISHLQLLFQAYTAQSTVPDSFLVDYVRYILKRGKYPDSCSSCQPITGLCVCVFFFFFSI